MSANESMLAYEWLMSTLTGDSTLMGYVNGVYRGSVPPGINPPYIVLSQQSSKDVTTANGYRVMVNLLMQVKVIGPASNTATLLSAVNEVDRLLKRTNGVQTTADNNGYTLACNRESPVSLEELVNGEVWSTLGGMYRIYMQQAN